MRSRSHFIVSRQAIACAVLVAGAWLTGPPAGAASPALLKLTIVTFGVQGLPDETASAARNAIEQQLAEVGASLSSQDKQIEVGAACVKAPACLRPALNGIDVDGALSVHAIRFGPQVRITITYYDASSGERVIEIESNAPARHFPRSAEISEDLKRGVEALRSLKPAPAPTPSPDTPSTDTPSTDTPADTPPLTTEPDTETIVASPDTPAGETPAPIADPPQPETGSLQDVETAASADGGLGPVLGIATTAVGGVVLVGGAITGTLWILADQQLQQDCPDNSCPPALDLDDEIAQRSALGWATPALFGVGAAVTAAGIAMLLLIDEEEVSVGESEAGN